MIPLVSTDTVANALITQQAHGISTNHGSVVVAGGGVTIQTNYHGTPHQLASIVEVLRLVPNLRKIHLDVLSKATPGTAIWILRTDYFLLWLDPEGALKILWGTGIRKCIQLMYPGGR